MLQSASIANKVQRQIAALQEGQAFVTAIEGPTDAAYFKALSRMVKAGALIRLEKGKYYKPKNSRFGVLRPCEAEIVKTLTQREGKTIGYLTGNALYNQWGLTIQLSGKITIARRSRLPEKEISGYKVKFIVRPFLFNEVDVPLLQLLDALTDIRQIPDASPANVISILVGKMKALQPSQLNKLAGLALKYPPSTRALLGALLDAYFPAQQTGVLMASLNRLTRYRIRGIDDMEVNKSKWYFI